MPAVAVRKVFHQQVVRIKFFKMPILFIAFCKMNKIGILNFISVLRDSPLLFFDYFRTMFGVDSVSQVGPFRQVVADEIHQVIHDGHHDQG